MRRRGGLALTLALFLGAATTGAQQAAAPPPTRPTDTVIPIASPIPLLAPSNADAAWRTLQRVLVATGVPFGLEGPVPTTAPTFDFAHPSVEVLKLSDMRLGAALDALAHVQPLVHWVAHDGMVVVRVGPGEDVQPRPQRGPPTSLLDRRVEHLDVQVAGVREALDLLVSLVTGRQDSPRSIPPNPPASVRDFTDRAMRLTIDAGTLRDVLDEVARQEKALSWAVLLSDPTGATGVVTIAMTGFDGWSMQTSVPIR